MPATVVNLNGVNELDLNLAGTVTATVAAGVTTINQTGVVPVYGDSTATALGGESVMTLGSTPVTGSVQVMLNGVVVDSSQYTISTNVVSMSTARFSVNDRVRVKWTTSVSTPGSMVLSAAGGSLHTFTASAYTGTNPVVPFPVGAVAGDLAVMSIGYSTGSPPTTPSGWTLVDNASSSGTFWSGQTYSKTLTSGDISTGSVTFTGYSAELNAAVVTFSGPVSIVDFISSRAQTTPATLTTSLSESVGNTAIYFGSQGDVTTGAVTWNRGISRASAVAGDGYSSCAVYTENLTTNGTVTAVVSYASSTSRNYQVIIVVNTPNLTSGTVPEVAQSQIAGLPTVSDTGVANAYAVAMSPSFSVGKGSSLSFIASNSSTGASTLSVNGGTPVTITKNGNSTAIGNGDITAGGIVNVRNDGTVWQTSIPGSGGGVTSLNTLTGALTLAAGTNITITPSGGNTLTFAATGGGGSGAVLSRVRYGTTGNRTSNTIYQNTTGNPLLVAIVPTASAQNATLLIGVSSPPTTIRSEGLAEPGGVGLYAFIPNNWFYELTGTSLTVSLWDEFQVTTGSLTDTANLSGSRSVGTTYQNTTGGTMFLQVISTAQTGAVTVVSDASASPTAVVWNNRPTASSILSTFIPIPNNHYYKVTGITVTSWYEPWLSLPCIKSANLISTVSDPSRVPLVSYQNTTGQNTFVIIVLGAVTSKFTQNINVDVGVPPNTNGDSYRNEGNGSGLTSVLAITNPLDWYYTAVDGSTYPLTSWFEYQLV